jgi:hypothetical protein
MKIWGYVSFENDDAARWLENLLAKQEISLLYEAFDNLIGENTAAHLKIKECFVAIAAAEILAQLVGQPTIQPVVAPGKLKQLAAVLTYDQCKLRMIRLAIKSTEKILTEKENSGICQVWGKDESDSALWLAAVNNMLARLKKAEHDLSF